ncbi:MAG: phosphoglucosamine mutase [Chloroflexi bacterium]|nr:phosphoglucosamine mutase [Chloroflexota bacterium]
MRLFGSSGIRSKFDLGLLDLGFKVGLAVGRDYKKIVVGADTRTSGDALKYAVISGLLAAGAETADVGITPTPTLALAARDYAAGVMITASHNPAEYNGIKLWNPDGSAFDAAQQRTIEEMVSAASPETAPWSSLGRNTVERGAIERHIARVLQDFPEGLNLRVALDCGGGAASLITPRLLEKLGCEVLPLNCRPTGFFPRNPEPFEASLGELMKATVGAGAALGIAHDGDADRMMAVDDRGRFISGDKMLSILARSLKARDVVTTVDASMLLAETGLRVRRTRVGDSFVSEELKRGGGDFGGEPSGAWIFPKISHCPDGIYAAARIVHIAGEQRLSDLVDSLPAFPLRRGNIESNGLDRDELEARLMALRPRAVEKMDGLRLNFEDGWLLVRSSGTEPKVRLTVEARTEARVEELFRSASEAVRECFGGRPA